MRGSLGIALLMALLLAGGVVRGQDTLHVVDTVQVLLGQTDTVYLMRTDTVVVKVVDSTMMRHLQDREALMAEKEKFYKEIFTKNGLDQNKIEADRDRYRHLVDSLRTLVQDAQLENVRKEEANKYLEKRAKEAEARVPEATNKKKKVRPIQGIAMRFFRTPNWEVRLQPRTDASGQYDGTYDKTVRNRNAGSIEFDFVTGASVMLWDLSPFFNKDHASKKIGETNLRTPELRKFDQEFAYDIGIYVGFGGSNLFKNFYVGPSFRFVDFFYLTVGFNIAEYEVLVSGYEDGAIIDKALDIGAITAKAWLMKPFIALNIDLDFLSYTKK